MKLPWPRSLHARLAGLLLALLLGLGGLLLAGIFRSSSLFFEEAHSRLNGGVAAHIAETIQPQPDGTFAEKDLKGLFMDVMVINPSLEVYLVDLEGRILAYDAPEELILRRRVDLAPVHDFVVQGPGRIVRGDDPRSPDATKPISAHPIQADGETAAYLYVILGGQGSDSILAALRQSWVLRVAAAVLVASLLVSAVVGLLAVGHLTRPLRSLRRDMASLVAGLSEDADTRGEETGDLASLQRSFDAMAERIRDQVRELEETDARRREFVAGISHDLRTPASSIQGYLETLIVRRERVSDAERDQYLETALRQAKRLSKLVEQLFELARLEAQEGVPDRETFSLAELVQDIVCEFQVAAERRGIALRARFPFDLPPVHADIGLIQRALDNLIDNALRYTEAGGEVEVSLEAAGSGVRVRVRDAGRGIAAEEIPRLFDRFYRVNSAGRDGGEGAGLGLAITRRIVDLHDSDIRVESVPERGTTFTFVLASGVEEAAFAGRSEE